jgi:hypothetical protein
MPAKTMTLGLIRMYEDMIASDFSPVIKVLEARSEALKEGIIIEVKKEMGVYDMLVKKAKLEFELSQLKEEIDRKTQRAHVQIGPNVWGYKSPIEMEVEHRLEQVNVTLVQAKAFRENLMREIKLATGTPEVRALFDKIEPQIKEWAEKVKKLPPIKQKQLTDNDKTVLNG